MHKISGNPEGQNKFEKEQNLKQFTLQFLNLIFSLIKKLFLYTLVINILETVNSLTEVTLLIHRSEHISLWICTEATCSMRMRISLFFSLS